MNPENRSRRRLLASCADLSPEDGTDPRHWNRGVNERQPGRKAKQLCRQAAEALNLALAGCRDDVLRDLIVVEVAPAPHSGRLLVTVAAGAAAGGVEAAEVLARLARAGGWLRSEVAAVAHRRKAPELLFRVAVRD
jgi:ribosome-binding factor A